jgi:hypothetical protein
VTELVPLRLRQQILRRVRYATNTLALIEGGRTPPEGLFDTAATNGLLAIVADQWPGEEVGKDGRTKPASALLKLLEDRGLLDAFADGASLREGLDLTQPARHGRDDDEFEGLTQLHIDALVELDNHPALSFLDVAEGESFDQCVVLAYAERVDSEMGSPKDRASVPEPDNCDECGRRTFLARMADDFGGDNGPGECLACGYERTVEMSYEMAVSEHIRQLGEMPD